MFSVIDQINHAERVAIPTFAHAGAGDL